jgi:hypothetical protein
MSRLRRTVRNATSGYSSRSTETGHILEGLSGCLTVSVSSTFPEAAWMSSSGSFNYLSLSESAMGSESTEPEPEPEPWTTRVLAGVEGLS